MSKGSILLVDDDWEAVNLLSQILYNEGYSIDVARQGLEAIERAKQQKHFAAIIDYVMPYYQGDEIAKKIRAIDPEIHLFLLTGYRIILHPSVLRAFDYVLEKPLNLPELLRELEMFTSGAHEMYNEATASREQPNSSRMS